MNDKSQLATRRYSFGRVFRKLILVLSTVPFCTGWLRWKLLTLGGVKIKGPCFIGANVLIDTMRPDLISIGSGCVITSGVCILSHFYSPKDRFFYFGEVNIGKGVFIGLNTVIANAVNIGDNAVIGAGSVVVKDIPAGEVWGGNPARFIKKVL